MLTLTVGVLADDVVDALAHALDLRGELPAHPHRPLHVVRALVLQGVTRLHRLSELLLQGVILLLEVSLLRLHGCYYLQGVVYQLHSY